MKLFEQLKNLCDALGGALFGDGSHSKDRYPSEALGTDCKIIKGEHHCTYTSAVVCKICGMELGCHKKSTYNCPNMNETNASDVWLKTKFTFMEK